MGNGVTSMRRYKMLLTLILFASVISASRAQTQGEQTQNDQKICQSIKNLRVGQTEVLRFDPKRPAIDIHIAHDTIADISFGYTSQTTAKGITFVFLTGKAPGTTTLLALDEQQAEVCGVTVNVSWGADVFKAGRITTFVCDPECRLEDKNDPTISSLPAGSQISTPVGGGRGLSSP